MSIGDIPVFRVSGRNTYTSEVLKTSGDSPQKRVTTPLQYIHIVNDHLQDRLTMSSTTARNTVKSRATWLMEVPAQLIPTACAHSVMPILAMFCFFEKTIHEEYISIKFDKVHAVHEEPEHNYYYYNIILLFIIKSYFRTHRSALTVLRMSTCLQKIT